MKNITNIQNTNTVVPTQQPVAANAQTATRRGGIGTGRDIFIR